MSFDQHERCLQLLFSHFHREAPVGYSKCSLSQVVNADKEAWKLLIQRNVKPRRDDKGEKPVGRELGESLKSYEVSCLLIPLPSKAASSKPDIHENNKKNQQTNKKFSRGFQVQKPKILDKGGVSAARPPQQEPAVPRDGMFCLLRCMHSFCQMMYRNLLQPSMSTTCQLCQKRTLPTTILNIRAR